VRKDPSGWCHGALLVALVKLAATRGYGLAAISRAGANAFFTRDGSLDPEAAWKPNAFRAKHSGGEQDGQWNALRDMAFVAV
jgi:hypothetical protein